MPFKVAFIGAVCNPPEIDQMTDEMLIAGEKWLPQYKDAIKKQRNVLNPEIYCQ